VERRADAGDVPAQLQLANALLELGQIDSARSWLRRAAQTGASEIKLVLAEHLLAVPPYEVTEALSLTREAATAGSAEAFHRLAVFAAEGVSEPQSWSGALDLLTQAAERGHQVANAELAALCGDHALASAILAGQPPPPDMTARARGIAFESLLSVAGPRALLPSPRIFAVPQFLPSGLCDWMISRARPGLRRAQTFNPRTGGAQVHQGRNHSCIGFGVARSDLIFAITRARMALLTGHAMHGFEDTSVLHYAPGEQFAPHYDFIDDSTPAGAGDVALTGQRAVTFLAYLNDGYDGGETAFPMLGGRYKGNKGDALFYLNVTPDGAPDRRTLHAGTPLKRGEKWLMSQWIRSRPTGLGQ
jgi:prolyl 4-hydroxylase